MKINRYFVIALLLMVFAVFGAVPGGAVQGQKVDVYSEYLTDSNGDRYGVNYFVGSTVNETTCVSVWVVNQDNVVGGVASPVILRPKESRFSLGSFKRYDNNKAWAVGVAFEWTRGATC